MIAFLAWTLVPTNSFMTNDRPLGNEALKCAVRAEKKEACVMVNRTLGWKRGDLRSGSGSSAAWISEFGHISASLHIGFCVYKIKTLDHRISNETQTLEFNGFVKDISNSGGNAFL